MGENAKKSRNVFRSLGGNNVELAVFFRIIFFSFKIETKLNRELFYQCEFSVAVHSRTLNCRRMLSSAGDRRGLFG